MQGRRLGPYAIVELLGAGGMGEVWLAQDTRLGRQVAVKVLPADFAADAERLARFAQEARAAAALSHPNIAQVHDVGEVDGTHFIVQEYLRGHSLRSLLAQGPLPLKRVLALAIEMLEALRAAHRAGIVHRDLKPDNIFITEDGDAKVLDFGLAKLMEPGRATLASQSMSPTVLGTQAGAIMGTAGYMAPEQVQGGEVDGRADLFAFGCVLYEMLSGRGPFAGKNVYETLGRIVSEEPRPLPQAQGQPPELRRILRKCLAKEPEARAQSAADLLVDLRLLAHDVDTGAAGGMSEERARAGGATSGISWRLAASLAVAAAAVAATATWLARGPGTATAPSSQLFEVALTGSSVDVTFGPGAVLSPDGRWLAVGAEGGDRPGLYVRAIDTTEWTRLAGFGVDNPVFSLDSRWLAYEQDGVLWKVPVIGGAPARVIDAPTDRGTAWLADGSILLAPGGSLGIIRVPVEQGDAMPVTELREQEAAHRWPQALPGGRHILFNVDDDGADWENATIEVADLSSGERKVLLRGGYFPRYVASGHLLYTSGGATLAVPFDLGSLEVTGPSFRALEGVATNSAVGASQYSVTDDGTLLYVPGGDVGMELRTQFSAYDGSGGQAEIADEQGFLFTAAGLLTQPSFSPDGTRLAYVLSASRSGSGDVWVYDLRRKLSSRLTTTAGQEWFPVWSADGTEIYYSLDTGPEAERGLFRRRADGAGEAERLLAGDWQAAAAFPDGKRLLIHSRPREGQLPVWVFDVVERGEPQELRGVGTYVLQPTLSSDGRWLAWVDNDGNVFVSPAEGGGRWQVSDGLGGQPLFSNDGRTIYYRDERSVQAVAADVADGALQIGQRRPVVSEARGTPMGVGIAGFWVREWTTWDGNLLLFLSDYEGAAGQEQHAVLITDWLQTLQR